MLTVSGEKVFVTLTTAQDKFVLPKFLITKFQDGEPVEKFTVEPAHCMEAGPPDCGKEFTDDLSLKSAHSSPVSAAKKASLVSRALVPNLTSLVATSATPSAIAKRMLESVTAKSKTNPEPEGLRLRYGAGPFLKIFSFFIFFIISLVG
jgi:hypothetical protein